MTEKSINEFIKAIIILKRENYKLFEAVKQQIDCINNTKNSN